MSMLRIENDRNLLGFYDCAIHGYECAGNPGMNVGPKLYLWCTVQ
jgi:hypothetical protein